VRVGSSIVSTTPVVYDDRGDARNATVSAISSGVAARPNAVPSNASRHRDSSPDSRFARALSSVSIRSVATGRDRRRRRASRRAARSRRDCA